MGGRRRRRAQRRIPTRVILHSFPFSSPPRLRKHLDHGGGKRRQQGRLSPDLAPFVLFLVACLQLAFFRTANVTYIKDAFRYLNTDHNIYFRSRGENLCLPCPTKRATLLRYLGLSPVSRLLTSSTRKGSTNKGSRRDFRAKTADLFQKRHYDPQAKHATNHTLRHLAHTTFGHVVVAHSPLPS
jgi:hypothetical protein